MRPERRKGGRRRSDQQPTENQTTITNDHSIGTIKHDERGDARWVWASGPQTQESADRTFNELKALDNEALALLEQTDITKPKSPPGGGYNPYDATTPPKKPTNKGRR